ERFGPAPYRQHHPSPIHWSVTMLLIREVFHCRPGKVRPLLEKFQAMNRIMAKAGQGNMRLMTDFSGERYWTLVAEFEKPGMAEFEKMMQGEGMKEADTKEFERLMEGYHDLIDSGHREIYRLEAATKCATPTHASPLRCPTATASSASSARAGWPRSISRT